MSAWRGVACAMLAAAPLAAQTGDARVVAGRVLRPGATGMIPVPGAWVVLHRVGHDRQGPVDSARSGANGAYRIRYRADGDENAVYFLATMHESIAYLSSPLTKPVVTGDDAEIDVYDTTSSGITLRERGRHVIALAPSPDGSREMIEVYELSNDARRTLVPAGAGRSTWSAPLPAGASDVHAEQGDVSPDALAVVSGRVEVLAPFAPGMKQVGFTYRLPANAFPLSLPAARDTLVLEALLEERGATAAGAGLKRVDDQTVGGHHLARYLAPNAPPTAPVIFTAGRAPASHGPGAALGLVAIMVAMMAGALTVGLRRTA